MFETQGTVQTDPRDVILPSVYGLTGDDVLVIVTTGGRQVESIGNGATPSNVRVSRFIPYTEIMPYASVLVSNGGYVVYRLPLRTEYRSS